MTKRIAQEKTPRCDAKTMIVAKDFDGTLLLEQNNDGVVSYGYYERDVAQQIVSAIVSEMGFTLPCPGCPDAVPAVPPVLARKRRPRGAQEYKGNGNHAWEPVAEKLERVRVPGGWLYRSHDEHGPMGATFVPVPDAVGYAV